MAGYASRHTNAFCNQGATNRQSRQVKPRGNNEGGAIRRPTSNLEIHIVLLYVVLTANLDEIPVVRTVKDHDAIALIARWLLGTFGHTNRPLSAIRYCNRNIPADGWSNLQLRAAACIYVRP